MSKKDKQAKRDKWAKKGEAAEKAGKKRKKGASAAEAEAPVPKHLPRSYARELADFAWYAEADRGASTERLAGGLFTAVPWSGAALCLVAAFLTDDAPASLDLPVEIGALVMTALLVASFLCAVASRLGVRRHDVPTPTEAVARSAAAGSGEQGYVAVVQAAFERTRERNDKAAGALAASSVLAFIALGLGVAGLTVVVVLTYALG